MSSLDQALSKIRAGRSDEAIALLDRLAEDPTCRHDALGHRAWLLRSLGRHEEALRDYDDLTRLEPDDLYGAALRTETQLVAGQAREALAGAVTLLQRDPLNAIAARVVAQAQRALGITEQPSVSPTLSTSPGPMPSRPLNPVIEQLEQDPASFPTSVYPEIGRFLYIFTRLCRPRLVLETGCYIGYSTLCLAQALADNGQGRLHSFDLGLDQPGYVSPVIGPCGNSLTAARAHVDRAGLNEQVTFHQGDSSIMIQRQFGDRGVVFDLAFIDGDHTLRGCLKDWAAIDALLAEGGVILLHDTMPMNCQWLGPRYLLEELPRRAAQKYHCLNLPSADGCGLGMIQKKTTGAGPRWRPSIIDMAAQRLFHTR